MSLLSDRQLAGMRRTMEQMLPDSAAIQRPSITRSGGEDKKTWVQIASAVPCRIAPVGGGESGEIGDRVAQETTHRITFASGTDVTEADEIEVDGQSYEVTRVDRRGSWELTRRVQVREAG